MCQCTRCGEFLTAPKFFNGKPYGFTCYEMVAGKKPSSKDKRQYVKVDPVNIPEGNSFQLSVSYSGQKFKIGLVFKDDKGFYHSPLAVFSDGDVYLMTHDKTGKPVFKFFA